MVITNQGVAIQPCFSSKSICNFVKQAAFGRSATSTQKERKGKGIGTGVGTADHRKNILGNRELGQERIWNDLSSATKKILENNIFSG